MPFSAGAVFDTAHGRFEAEGVWPETVHSRPEADGTMDHHELRRRIAGVVEDEATVGYLIHWAADGRPLPTFISLVPHSDGTVTATQGDLRERVIPVLDEAGEIRVFSDEASACDWAWQEIRAARRPPPVRSAEQEARLSASGDEKRRLRAERNAQWKAERDATGSA